MPVKSLCGVVLISANPEALARFYAEALELSFDREDHAGLAPHWGVDIGNVHFGIHPPGNFQATASGRGSVALAFAVTSLAGCRARLERIGATCVLPEHDEGFGPVALWSDPEGNLFEVVELTYQFRGGGRHDVQ
jgi:predicted enzyme related to lactoylglutathione lyase